MPDPIIPFVSFLYDYDIVIVAMSTKKLPQTDCSTEAEDIKIEFIPDRRIFIFRRIGKPALGQSPPLLLFAYKRNIENFQVPKL